jgi:hypothetical protein
MEAIIILASIPSDLGPLDQLLCQHQTTIQVVSKTLHKHNQRRLILRQKVHCHIYKGIADKDTNLLL